MKLFAAVASLCLVLALAQAALGADRARLDSSFDRDGFVVTPDSGGYVGPTGLIEDGQGRLLATGGDAADRFVIVRHLPSGELDPSFGGGDGRAVVDISGVLVGARSVALAPDGKIVVAGSYRNTLSYVYDNLAIARLNPDGSPDMTFGDDGTCQYYARGPATTVAVQPDGKILVGGITPGTLHVTGYVGRFLPNCINDRSWGEEGVARLTAPSGAVRDLRLLPSGKVVVAGHYRHRLLLARLNADGMRDKSFGGGDGQTVRDVARCSCSVAWGLTFDNRRRIVVSGYLGHPLAEASHPRLQVLLARYLPSGAFDRSFGHRGIERDQIGKRAQGLDPVIQRDGSIIVAGTVGPQRSSRYGVFRYMPNGGRDQSFFGDGVFAHRFSPEFPYLDTAWAAIIDSKDRVVVAGNSPSPRRESKLVLGRILPGS